jgi:hypothetical protein
VADTPWLITPLTCPIELDERVVVQPRLVLGVTRWASLRPVWWGKFEVLKTACERDIRVRGCTAAFSWVLQPNLMDCQPRMCVFRDFVLRSWPEINVFGLLWPEGTITDRATRLDRAQDYFFVSTSYIYPRRAFWWLYTPDEVLTHAWRSRMWIPWKSALFRTKTSSHNLFCARAPLLLLYAVATWYVNAYRMVEMHPNGL